jgi:hypothetical protein
MYSNYTVKHRYGLPEKEDYQALYAYSFLLLLILRLPLKGHRD